MVETDDKENAIKIAVLESEMNGLREQHKAHAERTDQKLDKLTGQLSELVAIMNKGKGAFGFAMVLAATLGAATAAILEYFIFFRDSGNGG